LKHLGKNILRLFSILVYGFLYVPIFLLIVFSFNNSQLILQWGGFTLKWYQKLWADSAIWDAFYNSVLIAVVTVLVSAVLGTTTAIALNKYGFKGKSIYDGFLYAPIMIPEITESLALMLFYIWAGVQLGLVTVILGHIAFTVSVVVIVVRSRLAGLDLRVEEAARSLGANELQTFFRITLPLLSPGILAGVLLAFTWSFDDFLKTVFTRGPGTMTLPVAIFNMASRMGVAQHINALATIMVTISLTISAIRMKFGE
jgi:spermidine/putrescine transport system permease protein